MHRDRPGGPGWSDTQQLQHTGKDGGPITMGAVQWRDEMLRMMAEAEKEAEDGKK